MTTKSVTIEKLAHSRMMRRGAAAEYLGVSASYLAKLAVYGGGPRMIRAGRLVLYDPNDLDDWCSARKVTSTSEASGSRAH